MTSLFAVAYVVNAFENPSVFWFGIVLLAVLLSLLRRNYGFSFFLTIALTFVLTQVIKSLYKVARPLDALVTAPGYRFPSMHASIAAAILTSLAWHWFFRIESRLGRIALISGTAGLIMFVGWTRILLKVHEVVDVVAGVILGAGISVALHYAMRRYKLE